MNPTGKAVKDDLSFIYKDLIFLSYFVGGLECVGHSFAYVAHFAFLRYAWIRTKRADVASRGATNLATQLPIY